MSFPTKITTCCYCGSRAALVLRGKDSHELTCQSCGAPIHMMKRIVLEASPPKRDPNLAKAAISHKPSPKQFQKPKKKKRRKSKLRWFMKEVFEETKDALEDIFD